MHTLYWGINISRGSSPNTSESYRPGVQILWRFKYFITGSMLRTLRVMYFSFAAVLYSNKLQIEDSTI